MSSSGGNSSAEEDLLGTRSSSDENNDDLPEPSRKRRKLSPPREDLNKPISTRDEHTRSRIKKSINGELQKSSGGLLTQQVVAQSSFSSLGISPWIVASLAAMQITRPTPIQIESIPPILAGQDCIGGSKTGSGKTVAFSVPILQKWAEDPVGIFALILTPTR
jgi:ATP-dependent RNA helicase DDX49/DBP8